MKSPSKSSANNSAEPNRQVALEGLRGIAALMVVFFHALISIFPFAFYGPLANVPQHSRFEDNFYGFLFSGLFNGVFWVAVFFVLSGFVLSYGYFVNSSNIARAIQSNTNQALKRYWRLMIPACTSVMLAYVLLRLQLNHNQAAYAITGSPRLNDFWNFEPNFFAALWQGVVGIFYGYVQYNPVLWTMQWELLGSFLVFGMVALLGTIKYRFIAYTILCIVLVNSYLLGFVLGVMLADLWSKKRLPEIRLLPSMALVAISLILAGFPKSTLAPWSWLAVISDKPFHWYFMGAVALCVLCLTNPSIKRLFSHQISLWFGRQTFSVYLLHDLLLLTAMSALFVKLSGMLPYTVAGIISIVSLLVLLLPSAIIFTRYVDEPAIKFSRYFASKLSRHVK